MWVAKEWRNVCADTCLAIAACSTASFSLRSNLSSKRWWRRSIPLRGSTESVPFYTDMRATLAAMGVAASTYDWFVSDLETNVPVPALGFGDVWVTGDELSEVLSRDVQFIWGVFNAVPRGTRFDIPEPPAADGNPRYWQPPEVLPQLDGACYRDSMLGQLGYRPRWLVAETSRTVCSNVSRSKGSPVNLAQG